MSQVLSSLLDCLESGQAQSSRGITIVPLFAKTAVGVHYQAASTAIAEGLLTIEELDHGGSVPELLATNHSELPVLLLDGEELIGAKQNRVANVTVLLRECEKTRIPVSCVEQGRWSLISETFSGSANMLTSQLRAQKHEHVRRNLAKSGTRLSDQGAIWAGIAETARSVAAPQSPTGAMHDFYQHHEDRLNEALDDFPVLEGQQGIAVMRNGKVVGIEFVSEPIVFATVYRKLLGSYLIEALDSSDDQTSKGDEVSAQPVDLLRDVLSNSNVETYPGVGYGREHRIIHPKMVGSALTLGGSVVHLSLLPSDNCDSPGANSAPPFSRSYWVQPGQLLAGCYPGDKDPAEAERKLRAMFNCGIRAIVSLMDEKETSNGIPFAPYSQIFARIAEENGASVVCIRRPIRDLGVPSPQAMTETLDTIDSLIDEGLPTYVHCWGGRGRTGTVVGCWLARHGMATGIDALQRLQHLRRNEETAHKASPQTDAQRNMVVTWVEGQ